MAKATRCTVCRHQEVARIEMLVAAGWSFERVAQKFGLNHMAVHRHWWNHVSEDRKATFLLGPAKLADLQEVVAEEGASRLDYLKILRSFFMAAVLSERERGNTHAMVAAGRALREVVDDIAELHGDMAKYRGPSHLTVNQTFLNDPTFPLMQSGLMEVGRKHPAALPDLVALMERLDKAAAAPKMIEATAA